MAPKNPAEFDQLFNKNIPHILEKIFLSLDYKSFKRCHEVCKAWREIVENESFRRRSKALYHDEMVDDPAPSMPPWLPIPRTYPGYYS